MKKQQKLFDLYSGLPKEFYALFLARIVNLLGTFVGPFFALLLTSIFDLSNSNVGVVVTINAFILVGGKLVGGWLSDRYSKRNVLMIGQVVSACLYLLVLVVSNNYISISIILFASFFSSIASPSINAMVADIVPKSKTKEAYSLMYLAANIGLPIASLLCGFLLNIKYELIFVVDALTTIAAVLMVYKYIHNDKTDFEIKQKEVTPDRHKNDAGIIAVLKKLPIVNIFLIIYFCYMVSYVQLECSLPLYITDIFGKTKGATNFSFLLAVNGISVILFTPILNIFMKNVESLINFAIGGILFAVGFGGYYFFSNLSGLIFCTFIVSIGEICIFTESTNYVMKKSPQMYRGRISSILELSFWAGRCLGTFLTALYLRYFEIKGVWIIIFVLMFISALFVILLYFYEVKRNLRIILKENKRYEENSNAKNTVG